MAGLDYKPTIINSDNPNIANSHMNGYVSELKLANEIAGLPDQQVLKYGDAIGLHGADIISVDVKIGEVTLWDSKFRSSNVKIPDSTTFMESGPLANAIREAIEIVRDSKLPNDINNKSIFYLDNRTFRANTVGAGSVRNSVQSVFVNGKVIGR